MTVGTEQLLQADQAATFQDRRGKGLRACHGASQGLFRRGWSLGLFQNERFYSANFRLEPKEAAGRNQIHGLRACGLRGSEISLLPSDVSQNCQKSGKRQAKLDRLENLNPTLNVLRALFELALLCNCPSQVGITMPGEGGKSMLFGQG